MTSNSLRLFRWPSLAVMVVIGIFAPPGFANECRDLFESLNPLIKAKSVEEQARQLIARAEASLDSPELTLTDRGFIASQPPLNPQLAALVAKRGLMWWGVRFYPVASLEAALQHSAAETDVFMQGNYIIVPAMANGTTMASLTSRHAPTVFRELLKTSEVVFIENRFDANPKTGLALIDPATNRAQGLVQTVRKVRRDVIDQAITLNELSWYENDPQHGPFFVQSGWTLPQFRGVIPRANIFDPPNENGHRKLAKAYSTSLILARQLKANGWVFLFNGDFQQALDKVRDQKRKVGNEWIANSRYQEKALYDSALASYHSGRAYSVEVWGPIDPVTGKRTLVGGIIGNAEGALFSPDSTFYDAINYPKIGIGFAEIAGVMLGERLAEHGVDLMDAGMVTPFTKGLRGKVIPTKQFLIMVDRLDHNVNIDFRPWDPPAKAYEPPPLSP